MTPDGITIPSDAAAMPPGNFAVEPDPGHEVTLNLSGKTINTLLKVSGFAALTADGKLAKGTEKLRLTQVMTTTREGTWQKVTRFAIDDGRFLVIIDETAFSYRVKLRPQFRSEVEVGGKAKR